MITLTTPQGWTFHSAAYVKVGDQWVDVDTLSAPQKQYISARLSEQALNAAYAGRRVYRSQPPLPPVETIFPGRKRSSGD
ncbi:hypothetical protein H7U37_10770 [Pseudoflavonifractor phocaeensis]|uniref:hypothetical protein n=1 Tax=Pseudoflavonifractor phocaeensis TaxID=1870988 RepID=UPI001957E2DD|nr:hypothetical protein [Pseudoflavonifractor phocaeensis]MBM6869790.1 hypothetical protein [Pseudoflavonifractor phocaeensis]MBM6939000.1 hypothetical protein [Pseudoflavonifractor phocaeensis]